MILPDLSDATIIAALARAPDGAWLLKPARRPRQVFVGASWQREDGQWEVDWAVVVERKEMTDA